MTESTLSPAVAGEDDKASLRQGSAEEIAAERPDGAEAASAPQAEDAVPPVLEAVTVAELLAAQELTFANPAAPPPQEDDGAAGPSPEATGTAETATASTVGASTAAESPAETEGGPYWPSVEATTPYPTERGASRSLTDALDAAARFAADADVATEAVSQAPAGSAPAADVAPLADADRTLDAPTIGPASAVAAKPGIPSLTKALDAVAQQVAGTHDEAEAAGAEVTAAPVLREAVPGEPPVDPEAASPAPGSAPAPAAAASVQPLTSALDAAVKLAADANAAAEALENLKRLLQRQVPGVAVGLATPVPSADAAARTAAPAGPAQPPPLPSLTMPAGDDDRDSGDLPQTPAPLAPRRAPERVRFDVRGFLAGFALSWAFGVVLYLFMTAG